MGQEHQREHLHRRVGSRALALASSALLVATGCAKPAPQPFPRPFHILAHRGASAYAPENTLQSVRAALELGAVEAEIDVQLSQDDHVVLFHDTTLDAKTNASGRVRDHTRAELEAVEIGSWFDATHPEVERDFAGTRLVALETLFADIGDRLVYHVELKSLDADLPRRTLDVVRAAGLADRVVFASFSFEQLERAHALAPEIPRAFLIRSAEKLQKEEGAGLLAGSDLEAFHEEEMDRARTIDCRLVAIAASELTPGRVAYAHARGMSIRAWRIRSDADMDHAIAVGANGMTTNWPDRLIRRKLEYFAGRPLPSAGTGSAGTPAGPR